MWGRRGGLRDGGVRREAPSSAFGPLDAGLGTFSRGAGEGFDGAGEGGGGGVRWGCDTVEV